jgi:hypothetical protein
LAAAWAWSLTSAFQISASAFFALGWADFGSALSTSPILCHQHRCSRVSGNTSADRGPEPQGTIADREHRRGPATALTASEQIESRLGRFAVPVVKRDEFLGAVCADPIITRRSRLCVPRQARSSLLSSYIPKCLGRIERHSLAVYASDEERFLLMLDDYLRGETTAEMFRTARRSLFGL